MARNMLLSIYEDDERIGKIAEVLSSKVRRSILRIIDHRSCSISEIAQELNLPLSTAAFHVKVLQENGMVSVREKPATRGTQKIVGRKIDNIGLQCSDRDMEPEAFVTTLNVPVGSYTDCCVSPTCGMASESSTLEVEDNPSMFYSPERIKAQVIWFSAGYVEYRIPTYCLHHETLLELSVSLEICSEAPTYRNKWNSDITFWINERELCTWTSPGDFGGRRGKLNPQWWPNVSSQYGLLKSIRIDEEGCYLDEVCVSNVRLSDLRVEHGQFFTFRVGIKENAVNQGGVNIFGEKFGDYEQNIVVRMKKR